MAGIKKARSYKRAHCHWELPRYRSQPSVEDSDVNFSACDRRPRLCESKLSLKKLLLKIRDFI